MSQTNELEREIKALRAELADSRRAQQALAAAQQTTQPLAVLSAAFEGILDPVFLHDSAGRLVYVNRAYLALVGQTTTQVLGRPYWEVFPRGDGPTPGCRQAMVESGVREEEIEGPTGQVLRMRSFALPGQEGDTNVLHSIHILEDITERRRHEQALAESEARLRLALTAAQAGYWDWDVRTGKIVWSPELYRLQGFDPAQAPPAFDEWMQRLHPDDRARTHQAIRDSIEGRVPEYRVEYRVLHPQWGVRWLFGIGRVEWAEDGTAQRLVGIGIDMTERHQAEEALRRANEELQRFAYVASHDLKAPLRAVHGLSSWIEEELAEHLSAEGRQRMALLRDRVQLMDDLINAVLDYSRAGAQIGETEEVDVAELVEAVVRAHGIPEGFTVTIATDLPCLRTARLSLQQVMANLIGNAINHHHRPDGHVWVSGRDLGAFYEFSVADDGPGIPPEYQERIFEMFQQGPKGKGGTGIGLAVVRRAVERVGGRVTLESAPDQGTTFRFTWPKFIRSDTHPDTSLAD